MLFAKLGIKLSDGLSPGWLLNDSIDLLRSCHQELLHTLSAGICYDILLLTVDVVKEDRVLELSDQIQNFTYPSGQGLPPALKDIKFWDDQQKARCDQSLFFSFLIQSISSHDLLIDFHALMNWFLQDLPTFAIHFALMVDRNCVQTESSASTAAKVR